MKKKPGVMIYFELRAMVKLLSDAEKGKLFEAILDYGETGITPPLTDTLKIAWPLIKYQLDADNTRYEQQAIKRKYAAYVRWTKEHNELPKAFPYWLKEQGLGDEEDMYHISPAC